MEHAFEFKGALIRFEAELLTSQIGDGWHEWSKNNKDIKGLCGVYYYRVLSNKPLGETYDY